ncbi:MAG: hypothetical protein ACOCUW_01685 [Gemmatimonadota bacterium]
MIPQSIQREGRAVTKRSSSSGSSGGSHDITGGGDRYEALLEVLEREKTRAQEEREWEARTRRQQGRRPYWPLAVLLAVAAWLWLFPPAFLRIEPPPPPSIEQEEQALRLTMYLQVRRIRAFAEETGRLPETLDQAGPPLPGMEYALLQPGLYQLTGVTDRLTLTYRSDLPLRDFAGDAVDLLDSDP